ncbi:unnamed protein product [Allacma fusca]|uniref:Uncharacterized protein n=1 Tax=Allacma fusca TaxID=39272 RepID=A0A8J2KSL2_9HEXA|nr:unnamed protein product [Allacma fusca]
MASVPEPEEAKQSPEEPETSKEQQILQPEIGMESTPILTSSTNEGKMRRYWWAVKKAKIEPAIILHMIAFKMYYITLQNILLEQACRVNLNFSDDICNNLTERDTDNLTDAENAVQQEVASIIRWRSVIDNFFPLIFVVFAGAWSDIYGRKLLIVLPLFGYISQIIGVIFCLADAQVSATTVALVGSIPVALTGSIATINMAIFSYIADNTPVESRTVRTGVTNAAFLIGMSSGNALGGFLSASALGFVGALGIAGALESLAFAWVIFVINNDIPNPNASEPSVTGIAARKKSWQKLADIFNTSHILNAVKTVVRKRDGNERLQIFMLIFACYFFITVPEYGEESVFYLFLRYQLNWDGEDYGYFATYRLLVGFVGGLLAIGLLSYKLKFSDPLVGIICSISQFSACFVYAFAKSTAMMYLGPAVDMWNSTMSLITKVIIAKIVPNMEIGKIYSFMGCVDALIPLIANPLYTTVYKATFENVLPGLFFLISAIMTIPPFVVFGWLMVISKRGLDLEASESPTTSAPNEVSGPGESMRNSLISKNLKSNVD